MNERELAQRILDIIVQASIAASKARSETYEMDHFLVALDTIKELCEGIVEAQQ